MTRKNIESRIERLEARTPDEPESSDFSVWVAILEEYGALKSSCAVYWRGGARQEPEHIPRKILGPGYTYRELARLAVETALEKCGYTPDEIEALAPGYVAAFEDNDFDGPVEWEQGEGIGYGTL